MTKIDWCLEQKKGIVMQEPNERLYKSYLHEADYNLIQLQKIEGKLQVVLGYYACYSAGYALLCRAGIKCEIHDCTLALLSHLPSLSKYSSRLTNLKNDRIAVQYYLKEKTLDLPLVKEFVNSVKLVSADELALLLEVCHGN